MRAALTLCTSVISVNKFCLETAPVMVFPLGKFHKNKKSSRYLALQGSELFELYDIVWAANSDIFVFQKKVIFRLSPKRDCLARASRDISAFSRSYIIFAITFPIGKISLCFQQNIMPKAYRLPQGKYSCGVAIGIYRYATYGCRFLILFTAGRADFRLLVYSHENLPECLAHLVLDNGFPRMLNYIIIVRYYIFSELEKYKEGALL